jgi:alpha-tubulin suppressor-like RCC1 family protein
MQNRLSLSLLLMFLVFATPLSTHAQSQQIAATSHLLWLKANGTIWAGGDANDGARGDGREPRLRKGFKQLPTFSNAIAIATRENTSAALLADGTVWAWGMFNGHSAYAQPKALAGMNRIRQFALGDDFVVGLKDDGTVWYIGTLQHGLNTGQPQANAQAVQVPGLAEVIAVGATNWAAFAVRKDGSVWGWGDGFANLLGASGRWDFFDSTKNDNPRPVKLSGISDVVALSGGHFFMLALTRDGRVYSWGNNEDGALGRPLEKGIGDTAYQMPALVKSLPRIKAISAGYDFSLAIDQQGDVWVWGNNTYGTLGVPETAEGNRFVPQRLKGIDKAVSVHGGHYHAFAVTENGDVMGWGENKHDFIPIAMHAPAREIGPVKLK